MKKVISVALMILFLVTGPAFAAQKMKIAVAANDKIPAAEVNKQAGFAPFFLLFDEKGKLTEAIENPFKDKMGAGQSMAELLGSKGVTILVAAEWGGQIGEVLKGKGIKAFAFKGSAEDAVKKLLQPIK